MLCNGRTSFVKTSFGECTGWLFINRLLASFDRGCPPISPVRRDLRGIRRFFRYGVIWLFGDVVRWKIQIFVHKSACLLIDCIDFTIFWNFAQKPLKLICISWFLWWNCNATYLTEPSFEKTSSMVSKMELQIITLEVLKICYGWLQNSLSESQLNKCFFLSKLYATFISYC